jgi:hypothetical protein
MELVELVDSVFRQFLSTLLQQFEGKEAVGGLAGLWQVDLRMHGAGPDGCWTCSRWCSAGSEAGERV